MTSRRDPGFAADDCGLTAGKSLYHGILAPQADGNKSVFMASPISPMTLLHSLMSLASSDSFIVLTTMEQARGAPQICGHCFMAYAGRASRNIASSTDLACRTKAMPMTCCATTFQIFRKLVPHWMRYPLFSPALSESR